MKNEKQRLTEEDYLNAVRIINEYKEQLNNHYLEVNTKNRSLKKVSELDNLDRCQMSGRLYNILKFNFMDVRLCDITKEEFFKARWCGVTTYNELCELINIPIKK